MLIFLYYVQQILMCIFLLMGIGFFGYSFLVERKRKKLVIRSESLIANEDNVDHIAKEVGKRMRERKRDVKG